jgi:hypothetical protein
MTRPEQTQTWKMSCRTVIPALAIALVLTIVPVPAQAQTFTVLHSFSGGAGGSNPTGSLLLDGGGNIYGTAYNITYKLSHRGNSWTLNRCTLLH